MKLLFSIDSLQAGGAEKSTLDIIHHLAEHWDIVVVYYYAKHDLKKSFELAPCKLIYVPLHRGYKFAKGVSALKKIISEEKIDIIVTSLYRSGIMSRIAGKQSGTPVIDTIVNDSYSQAKRAEFKHLHLAKFFAVKALDKLTAQIPRLWISNSTAIADTMGKVLGIATDKLKVIYRGRNTMEMAPWRLPESGSDFHFVAAGRLVPQKGFADLINAFAIVYKKMPQARLTIYGEGSSRQNLLQLIEDKGLLTVVHMPGRMPAVWQQFYHAHCFVLPSHYEGMSGVLIEAQITGIPIVASDIAMNVECAVSEDAVLFFEMGNVVNLAEKLMHTINTYGTIVKDRNEVRQKAINRFDLKHIAVQYHKALLHVMPDKR